LGLGEADGVVEGGGELEAVVEGVGELVGVLVGLREGERVVEGVGELEGVGDLEGEGVMEGVVEGVVEIVGEGELVAIEVALEANMARIRTATATQHNGRMGAVFNFAIFFIFFNDSALNPSSRDRSRESGVDKTK
jgi:hypothetical protein